MSDFFFRLSELSPIIRALRVVVIMPPGDDSGSSSINSKTVPPPSEIIIIRAEPEFNPFGVMAIPLRISIEDVNVGHLSAGVTDSGRIACSNKEDIGSR